MIFLLGCSMLFAQQSPGIIPNPSGYISKGYTFLLDENTSISFNNKQLADEAHFLQEQIFNERELALAVTDEGKSNVIALLLNDEKGIEGAYSMTMESGRVVIEASSGEGIFNGIISLMQLITFSSSDAIPCWDITDTPKHSWRGVMLDESRHFFGKEKVKSMLDWMAFYKLNRFHWHLTDATGWRIEIKKYPLLGYIGGIGNHTDWNAAPRFYTREDIREIVQYAARRKIEIIPEIDMPGHARSANRAYPEFSGGGSKNYPDFTFNPGLEGTYSFLTDILREVDVLFPSQMIHLGGDEVHFGNHQWNEIEDIKKIMKENSFTDLNEVEKYFMVRMADSLYAMGNKLLAWDEMADISLPVDKTIIYWWRHDKKDYLQKALERDFPVVLCPRIPLYFDFDQNSTHEKGRKWSGAYSSLEGVYRFNSDEFTKSRADQILGMQGNIWTERIQTEERLDYMMFPRVSALAESAWGTNNDYGDYMERLEKHVKLYQERGVNSYNPFSPDDTPEPAK